MPRAGVEGRMPGKKQMAILALLNAAPKNRMNVDEFLDYLHEQEVLSIYRTQMRRHALIACLALEQRGFTEVSEDRKTVQITKLGKSFLRTHVGEEARQSMAGELREKS